MLETVLLYSRKDKNLTEQSMTVKMMLVNCDLTIIHMFFQNQKSELSCDRMKVTTSTCHGFLMTMFSAHYNNNVHLSSDEYANT